MIISGVLPLLQQLPDYQRLVSQATAAESRPTLQVSRAMRVPLMAALAQDTQRPILILAERNDRAMVILEELSFWFPEANLLHFAEPNTVFYERGVRGERVVRQRLEAIAAVAEAKKQVMAQQTLVNPPIVVASARALLTRTIPGLDYIKNSTVLKAGTQINLQKLLGQWQSAGYRGHTLVVEPGTFSRRGGILDIWPVNLQRPVRIELFGDEVDTLRYFDPVSQRSADQLDSITVTPARESMLTRKEEVAELLQAQWPKHPDPETGDLEYPPDFASDFVKLAEGASIPELEYYLPWLHPTEATLLDYMPSNTLVVADHWQGFEGLIHEHEEHALEIRLEQIDSGLYPAEGPHPNVSWSMLHDQLSEYSTVILNGADTPDVANPLADAFTPGHRWGGKIKSIMEHLINLKLEEQRTVIVTRQAARLADVWGDNDTYSAPTDALTDIPQRGEIRFVQGTLTEGAVISLSKSERLYLLTDAELFGWARPQPRRRYRKPKTGTSPEAQFTEFQVDDYVVHVEHGIGRYQGLVTRKSGRNEREYLQVAFALNDMLYVPINQADRLTRYVGTQGTKPQLSSLGTQDWLRQREKARAAAKDIAEDLLNLYAQREAEVGYAFAPDGVWQRELEAAFPYVETEDQLKAINDVKEDLERPRPMDRLICGDVGYGKTEVALRAAFKVVMDGKQVAILVPTTVLAQQHFNTFRERLAAYPVKVEMLSRFRTTAEQAKITADLAKGGVDIIVGTHRLLSKDIVFKDLGMMVIDEEQRFGVTHKEHIKTMRTHVDVLTLTATPIPRTLYMSLTGVRDISIINTAPEERLPVITHVGHYERRLVRQAVRRELDRGGQVFYLHNRVTTIQSAWNRLKEIVPEARIGIGHGQMPEEKLAKVMDAFAKGELDILLCTTIIESGIDIPNANTLIIERADLFGLSQLYQIRGRVGRSANRAYAYFFTPAIGSVNSGLTPQGRERLQTIAEQNDLGAGYNIAMRDLEMRGAGDILGAKQSGYISSVGFHLYTRLLRQAVKRVKQGYVAVVKDLGPAPKPRAPEPEDTLVKDMSLVSVDVPLPTGLPSDYVTEQRLRLQLYRRLAEIETLADVADMDAELRDRFGPLPEEVQNLLYQIRLRILAYTAGVENIGNDGRRLTMRSRLWEDQQYRSKVLALLPNTARMSKGKVWLERDPEIDVWKHSLMQTMENLAKNPLIG